MRYPQESDSETDSTGCRAGRRGGRRPLSVGEDEKVLEMDGANGRTTVGMYLKSLNSTF